jgi:GTP pyrophosphokinase
MTYNPSLNRERIEQAYQYADRLHKGQSHLSGDPYIDHSLYVMETLITFHARENSIIAALLHGLPETEFYNPAEIEKLFGTDVADLVAALNMLNRLKIVNQKADVDSLRKMFLAMAQDLRVVMIKLADRLQNLQRIEKLPVGMRKGMARETLDIFVPISSRMGIYTVKVQLEDLCFKLLFPKQYEVLIAQLNEYKLKRGKDIEEIKKELKSYMDNHEMEVVVEGRIKNLYSIYRKLKMKSHTTLEDIYDVFAMRVILPTRMGSDGREQSEHLYAVLGLIHSKWKPLANRFKDYVAVPKPNGYQSLHTAVVGLSPLSSQATEIQIRSRKMHDEAEFGIASHWVYEDLKKVLGTVNRKNLDEIMQDPRNTVFGKYVTWLDALSKLQRDVHTGTEFMEALKLDIFNDRIFVMTPGGEVKDMPLGATPVDFAYAVHTDVGHKCMLAKVNGAVVPLDYKMKSGEVIEIITGNKPHPKLHWLSFVKTAGARTKIKGYFKGLDKERSFREGKEIINKYLLRMQKPLLDDELSILREYGGQRLPLKERELLVEEIGSGSVLVQTVLRKIFGKAVPSTSVANIAEKEALGGLIVPKTKRLKVVEKNCVYIAGETGVPYKFAQCCKPMNGQPIVAYVTRGNAVTVHQSNCKLLKEADQERIIAADWNLERDMRRYPVKVALKMHDRIGLIRDIAEAIASFNVNIIDFGAERVEEKDIIREMIIEVTDNEQYQGIVEKLRRVRNVFDVIKVG